MKDFNMTGENIQYNNNFKEITMPSKKKEPKFGFWDLVLTLIFLASFFGCIYLYLENRTLKQEIEQKHLLIMDFSKLLKSKKP